MGTEKLPECERESTQVSSNSPRTVFQLYFDGLAFTSAAIQQEPLHSPICAPRDSMTLSLLRKAFAKAEVLLGHSCAATQRDEKSV